MINDLAQHASQVQLAGSEQVWSQDPAETSQTTSHCPKQVPVEWAPLDVVVSHWPTSHVVVQLAPFVQMKSQPPSGHSNRQVAPRSHVIWQPAMAHRAFTLCV